MKIFVLLSLVAVAASQPVNEVIAPTFNYHEHTGIAKLASIKRGEEALDFDGSRIVGGSAASLGQFPHMGGVIVTLTSGQQSVCGSSLITTTRSVSAAHCWFDGRNQARQFTLVFGSLRLFTGGSRINSNNVRVHPSWNPNNARNDVMTVNHQAVPTGTNIRAINLATGSNLFVGVNAQAAGFGLQRDGGQITQQQALHHVTLRVIPNAECRRSFPLIIQDTNICTSGERAQSVCSGDSGGPLATAGILIGIVSFGSPQGCERGHPAAYARVSSYANWVRG